MNDFYEECKQYLEDIRFDEITKRIYSVDASIFEISPLAVFCPKDTQEIVTALKLAHKHRIPVTARGAATGITGACLGSGLIIDTSKYLNKIHEIDKEKEYVICEPGVIQDRLNEKLSPLGYRLGPDTSTGNRATLGGMLANNAAGSRSLYYGKMIDHVESVELALITGELITFGPLSKEELKAKCEQNDLEGEIYRKTVHLLDNYKEDILKNFPKIPRHVSGYNLDALLTEKPFNLSKIIVGSEGTLGIVTSIKVKITKKPPYTTLYVIHSNDMLKSLEYIETILTLKPMALELIDDKIIQPGLKLPLMKNRLQWLRKANETSLPLQALLIAEFAADTESELLNKIKSFETLTETNHFGIAYTLLEDPQEMNDLWELRKAGLGLLLSKRSFSRAIAFIEDISVPPEKLGAFMAQFCHYLKTIGKEAGIYGHIGSGCMHIRPYIDLSSQKEIDLMQQMMKDVSNMILDYHGSMSGEHGDGLIRSWLNEKMFGPQVYQAFIDLKSAFDPLNLMNPGKIVHGELLIDTFRTTPNTELKKIKTFLDFSQEGGFELAVDLCNGNGQCRKAEKVMCPSFQATGDEYDTTRARAQILRGIIHGKLPEQEFTGKALYDVLDLCLECKGCKRECPSQIDMAKMKSEFLFQYQQKHGISLRQKLFGNIHRINRLSAPFATLFNIISRLSSVKYFLSFLGISPKRNLPTLSKERFSTWFHRQKQLTNTTKQVVLFNDTYTEFNQPSIGIAATSVLKALGYHITLVENVCCGRPLISKGLLKQAQESAKLVIEALFPFANQGLLIVGMEPSCFSAIKDDYLGLLPKPLHVKLEHVINACLTIDDFLHRHLLDGKFPIEVKSLTKKALVHGHCHQKTLWGMQTTLEVLASVNIEAKEIDSGCCGLAGSFGYEKEHYDISMKIGELKLLPAIRQAHNETLIIANGMSCRSQITHGTTKSAMHFIEAIADRIIND